MPARSVRTPSSAAARSVRPPDAVSGVPAPAGRAPAANRKIRTAYRSESRLTSELESEKARCIAAVRVPPSTSARRMLRESSSRMASTLRCGTALESTSVGPQEAAEQDGERERAQHSQHDSVGSRDPAQTAIRDHDERHGEEGRKHDQPDRHHRREHQLTSPEQPRRILEQKREDGLERSSHSHSE